MGFKFIIGRSGAGKSKYCIDEIERVIKEDAHNKVIMLVPEQYTFETENKLLREMGEQYQLNAEVLSFKRLAHKVFSECGGITKNRLQDSGKSMLILKVLNELNDDLTAFKVASRQKGFIDIVSKTIAEFKKYNIDEDMLRAVGENLGEDREDLKLKIRDLTNIYSNFQEKLHKSYIDSEDELLELSDKLDGCSCFDDAHILIDEFTSFTPIQYYIIEKLLKKSKSMTVTLTMDVRGNSGEAFLVTSNTFKRLKEMLLENKIAIDEVIDLNKEENKKFNKAELLHLERNCYSYPYKQFNDNPSALRIYKANNNYDEIEFIARDILRLVRKDGYRYRDISVICRAIDGYEKIASVIFAQYGIPCYIDKKKDIMSNPLIVLINSLFDIVNKNWNYESVFKYLKTGLIDVEKKSVDLLENYVLSNGIKGKNQWTSKEPWQYPVYNSFKDKEKSQEEIRLLNEIDETRQYIMETVEAFYKKVSGKSKVEDYCAALYEFLNDFNILERMEKVIQQFQEEEVIDKATEYSKVLDIIMEVLDEGVEVLGDEVVDFQEFSRILNMGFQKYEMALIPLALDQVTIGDVARIKSREVKALYVVGVNDGIIPAINKEEGILSDRDRQSLKEKDVELASDTKTKAREEQHLVYNILSIAREYLVLTYAASDFEGKALRQSIIIPRIKKIFTKLQEESDIYVRDEFLDELPRVSTPIPTFNEFICKARNISEKKEYENYWLEVYHWFNSNEEWQNRTHDMLEALSYTNQAEDINREKIKKLYETGDRLVFNISRIESYAKCPFAYYVKYGLKAKDRKIYELTAPDLGSFMHEILDEFTNEIRTENLTWSDLSFEQCKTKINDLVDKQLEQNKSSIFNSSNRYRYFTDRFKRMLTKSVTVISEQMRKSNFEIFKNEYAFGSFKEGEPIKLQLPSGEEVFLTGRIDRIDTVNIDGDTYIRIIDYKTGQKKFDLSELYYGIQIQLLVYLDALIKNSQYIIEKQALPGAIFYFRIDDPFIKANSDISEEKLKEEVLSKLKLDGLMLKEPQLIKSMDNDIEGSSLIIPAGFKKDGDFSKSSAVITEKQFDILRKYVNDKMIELCTEMLSGKIRIEPIKQKLQTQCKYCDYSSICQFDTNVADNSYRFINAKPKEEVWADMQKETGILLGGDENGN